MPISISVVGAGGRMGKKIIQLIQKSGDFELAGGSTRPHSPDIGHDLGTLSGGNAVGMVLESDKEPIFKKADVIIDFSSPQALKENLEIALRHKKPVVIGTTGHDEVNQSAIEAASKTIPILFSSNFSIGMNLCFQAVAFFAKTLKGNCRIDIVETHHDQKKDIPSGSALSLAEASAYDLIDDQTDPQISRPSDTIAIHSIREGNALGEHLITFHANSEIITLKHQALSRDLFASGALKAAKFLISQPPGLYSLKDFF